MVINLFRWAEKLAVGFSPDVLLESVLIGLAGLTLGFMPLYYIAEWMDNKKPFTLTTVPRTLVSFLVCMVVAAVSQWKGLFLWRHQSQWAKTEHSIRHLEMRGGRLTEGSGTGQEKNNSANM